MYSSEYFYSETTTTYSEPTKARKIPVTSEDGPVAQEAKSNPVPSTSQAEAPVSSSPAPAPSQREAVLAGDLQRLQAEYVNYRNRVERDRHQARTQAVESTLEKLLPVLDDITAARQFGDLENGPFAAIANKLEATVKNLGFTVIDEVGVPFDPTIHETVMMQQGDEFPADHVTRVLRNGYLSGTKTIRPAQVIVSAG